MKLRKKSREWIVCLGGEDWWYHSHAHFDIQMMKMLSRKMPILYVCSIGMRMPSLRKDKLFGARIKRKLKSIKKFIKSVDTNLFVYSPIPFPLYQNKIGRLLNKVLLRIQLAFVYKRLGIRSPLIWVNTPTAWPVVKKFQRRGIIYQRTDDYAAYDFDNFNSNYVSMIDENLTRSADLVIHVSDELHKEASKITKHSIILDQGVDNRFFEDVKTVPADLKGIRKPIIGYVGGMDRHKFDSTLVAKVAEKLPRCSFVMVGADNPNINNLRDIANVHFLGNKSHDEIPGYIHNFDVCVLPTARTEWGIKCRPLKLMEYLASKKPVVATATPASKKYCQYVHISDDAEAWVDFIKQILKFEKYGQAQSKKNSIELNSWENTARKILRHLSKINNNL